MFAHPIYVDLARRREILESTLEQLFARREAELQGYLKHLKQEKGAFQKVKQTLPLPELRQWRDRLNEEHLREDADRCPYQEVHQDLGQVLAEDIELLHRERDVLVAQLRAVQARAKVIQGRRRILGYAR